MHVKYLRNPDCFSMLEETVEEKIEKKLIYKFVRICKVAGVGGSL